MENEFKWAITAAGSQIAVQEAIGRQIDSYRTSGADPRGIAQMVHARGLVREFGYVAELEGHLVSCSLSGRVDLESGAGNVSVYVTTVAQPAASAAAGEPGATVETITEEEPITEEVEQVL